MKQLTDQELKREFESSKNQLRLALYGAAFLVLGVAVFVILFKDPFGWMTGSPPVREAKKWIVLCIFFVLGPALAALWFMVIRPIQTGILAGGSKHRAPYVVLRSEDPERFRGHVWWNCFLVAAALGLAVWLLIGFARDLRKAQKLTPNPPHAANPASCGSVAYAEVSGGRPLIRHVRLD